ncbi:MAG TPA: bacteriohemerythrin [Noviherbaspirillum sp.]|nr:bacteriohemerythrin [Noviherbaspirillum sp.]
MLNSPTIREHDSPQVSWTEDLSIGHAMIDADHRHIFDIANRIQEELLEQPEYSIVGEVLVELIEHTGDHFLREEALMQALRYPEYDAHKREHETLMQKVNALHRRFMDGEGNLSAEVAEFMQDNLIRHIVQTDKELGRSMRAR